MNQLLSTVFHEVRNPLGVINLHAELIMRNPEKAALSAEIISRTSRDLEQILTELLDFSKPVVLEKTEGNLECTVSEVINLIKPGYDEKNIELTFKNSLNKGISLNFDKTKINQVLFNLLKNALEASKPGDKVEVSLEKKHNSIFIKISDQGSGIPAENREKIFKPYFTTKKQGTGIGLAEAKKIVEAHQGSLYIDTKKTGGTAFIIQLKGG
ncbi:MAG: hypothetical protein A2Y25_11170 [Candidatus Melainabacteria bacterium GWF2_37_15]|nr:MAG: hypothetical protein A2Y25_11170 [Candidatus Melainabacteria bacterium GWF2_37_15]